MHPLDRLLLAQGKAIWGFAALIFVTCLLTLLVLGGWTGRGSGWTSRGTT